MKWLVAMASGIGVCILIVLLIFAFHAIMKNQIEKWMDVDVALGILPKLAVSLDSFLMRNIFFIFVVWFFIISSAFALEGLDELEARKSRQDDNTFYSGENPGNYYIWQPHTLIYQDTTSGHEVTAIMYDPLRIMWVQDVNWSQWSADGKRFAFNYAFWRR